MSGSVIRRKRLKTLAPSILAASITSLEMPCRPVSRMTMVKPAVFQTTIRMITAKRRPEAFKRARCRADKADAAQDLGKDAAVGVEQPHPERGGRTEADDNGHEEDGTKDAGRSKGAIDKQRQGEGHGKDRGRYQHRVEHGEAQRVPELHIAKEFTVIGKTDEFLPPKQGPVVKAHPYRHGERNKKQDQDKQEARQDECQSEPTPRLRFSGDWLLYILCRGIDHYHSSKSSKMRISDWTGARRRGPPRTQPLRVGAVENLGEVVLRLLDRSIDVIAEDRALDQVEERSGAADEQLIRRERIGRAGLRQNVIGNQVALVELGVGFLGEDPCATACRIPA